MTYSAHVWIGAARSRARLPEYSQTSTQSNLLLPFAVVGIGGDRVRDLETRSWRGEGGEVPSLVPPLNTISGNHLRHEHFWRRRLRWITDSCHPVFAGIKCRISSMSNGLGRFRDGSNVRLVVSLVLRLCPTGVCAFGLFAVWGLTFSRQRKRGRFARGLVAILAFYFSWL